ncbi:MAG: family 43 glycosylhydrolase [Treponemataceae bacterium]|nr:family 43 glycosylhydrolase [Treponemataceae bacterium]
MKTQAFNPYLPYYEYIPDGEPYVFDGRVYIYGSHDRYNGPVFCMNDYVTWSAPVDDLGNWRYEGVIFEKTQDPANPDGAMCLYAPDMTIGPDGKYYLYYCLDKIPLVSVAVCDSPAGKFQFLGYVHYKDGTRLGERAGDEPQFDPGVITEGDRTYLYTGFCGQGDKSRHGSFCTTLDKDMLTIIEEPVLVAPGVEYCKGTGFEGHAFFEASSIRKRGDLYYLIYSSTPMHELCYATAKNPRDKFTYGGVIVSNVDVGIGSYKEKSTPAAYGANNHGSIVQIGDDWYIFYHRHTNGTWFARQGCAEKIAFEADGSIPQVEITSCGLNGGPLAAKGEYPAYIACNLFTDKEQMYVAEGFPRIMQEGRDGDEELSYISAMVDSATAGFKYFDFAGVKSISVETRGYASGVFEVRTSYKGPVIAEIPVEYTNIWVKGSAQVAVPDGVYPLYLTFRGQGTVQLRKFFFD